MNSRLRLAVASGATAWLALALTGAGCVTGQTPDCSSPDAGCGPGIDGSFPTDAEAGAIDAAKDSSQPTDAPPDTPPDSPVDTGSDTGTDSGGDAATD